MPAIFYNRRKDRYVASGGLFPKLAHIKTVDSTWEPPPHASAELTANLKVFYRERFSVIKPFLLRAYYKLLGLEEIKVSLRAELSATAVIIKPFTFIGGSPYWLVAVGYQTFCFMNSAAFSNALARGYLLVLERKENFVWVSSTGSTRRTLQRLVPTLVNY